MTIDFPINTQTYGEYCPTCKEQGNTFEREEELFVCAHCGASLERLLIIDPKLNWWLDNKKTYWHESAGILLLNQENQLLFYELTKFPFGLTIPAGHVDEGETPEIAASREAKEEVGVDVGGLTLCLTADINGDSCRRGSDNHRWSLFATRVTTGQAMDITVDAHEGKKPIWLSLEEATAQKDTMPPAMQFFFSGHLESIRRCIANLIN